MTQTQEHTTAAHTIRPITTEDIECLLVLENECFNVAWTKYDFLLNIDSPSCTCIAAEKTVNDETTIIGYVIVEHGYPNDPDVLESTIVSIAVLPTHQRTGVGTALLNAAMHGERLYCVAVPEHNLTMQLFLRSIGYRARSMAHDYFAPEDHAIMMARRTI